MPKSLSQTAFHLSLYSSHFQKVAVSLRIKVTTLILNKHPSVYPIQVTGFNFEGKLVRRKNFHFSYYPYILYFISSGFISWISVQFIQYNQNCFKKKKKVVLIPYPVILYGFIMRCTKFILRFYLQGS